MTGYTKLFSSIVTSTIWRAPDKTRILWITMLAIADRYGEVQASIPGLAHIAGIDVKECQAAIATLEGPDEFSRTPDNEGRRIGKIDGGWQILNYEKYREIMNAEDRKEYKARKAQEARDRKKTNLARGQIVDNRGQSETEVTQCRVQSAECSVQNTEQKEPLEGAAPPLPFSSDAFKAAWEDWQTHRKQNRFPALKPKTLAARFAEFSGWGEAKATQAIRESIKNGWRGIFEPKTAEYPFHGSSPQPPARIGKNLQ